MSTDGAGPVDRLRAAVGRVPDDRRSRRATSAYASNISLSSRLVLVVLAATIASLIVVSTVSLLHGAALADRLLEERMEALAGLKGAEVEDAVNRAAARVGSLAGSEMVRDATRRFSGALAALEAGDDPAMPRAEEELAVLLGRMLEPGNVLLQGVGHDVERVGQLADFVSRAHGHPCGQVAGRKAARGARETIDRVGQRACKEPGDGDAQHQHE